MKLTSGVTVIAVVSGAALLLYFRHRHPRKIARDDDEECISLLPFEEIILQNRTPPVNTVTFFHGNNKDAAQILAKRVERLVQANPWLLGRLDRTANGRSVLIYSKKIDSVTASTAFSHWSSSRVARKNLNLRTVGKLLKDCLVKTNNDGPLYKVTLVPDADEPETRFAVAVSMSHALGDGHTFYQLHNSLLSNDTNLVTLNPHRIPNSTELQIEALGKDQLGIMSSMGFILAMAGGMLWANLPWTPIHKINIFLVKPDEMRVAKTQAAVDIPFCSTNDVIVSWFSNLVQCDHVVMAINLRNRMECHSDSDAGNYEALLLYNPEDYAMPSLIRKSLSGRPFGGQIVDTSSDQCWPTFQQQVTAQWGICSNWATFARANVITSCKEDLHLPLYDMGRGTLPSNLASCLLFRAGADENGQSKLAVLVGGKEAQLLSSPEAWKETWIGSQVQ